MIGEGAVRRLATLTSVRRSRGEDTSRNAANGDPGRESRVAKATAKVKESVEALEKELGI